MLKMNTLLILLACSISNSYCMNAVLNMRLLAPKMLHSNCQRPKLHQFSGKYSTSQKQITRDSLMKQVHKIAEYKNDVEYDDNTRGRRRYYIRLIDNYVSTARSVINCGGYDGYCCNWQQLKSNKKELLERGEFFDTKVIEAFQSDLEMWLSHNNSLRCVKGKDVKSVIF